MTDTNVSRRTFLTETATAASAGTAASLLAAHQQTQAVAARSKRTGERIRIGIIGPGRRGFGSHVRTLVRLRERGTPVDLTGVCDVYTVHRDRAVDYIKSKTGLSPKIYSDYRDMLADGNIDAVCIGTPDHWHAKQTLDALKAGKHVYCEKPMTHTLDESLEVVKAWKKSGLVMQVGVQGTSMPIWDRIRELLDAGGIGKVVQFQTEYARNSLAGMSRHNVITKEMTPQTIDWKRWLGVEEGLAPMMTFDRAVYGQWRCYWPFSNGMYGDLLVHRVTAFLKATGLRFPARVTGGGGIFLEYDDREVPDVATVVADYHEGVQGLVSSTMVSQNFPLRQLIRGHHGVILLGSGVWGGKLSFEYIPERPQVTLNHRLKRKTYDVGRVRNQDDDHFTNFLEAVRAGDPGRVNNSPDLGAAAVAMVNLAIRSYREGKVFHMAPGGGAVTEGNADWAAGWEKMSKTKSKAHHIPGWHAGDAGSVLVPFKYQKLAGPWINGRPPEGS